MYQNTWEPEIAQIISNIVLKNKDAGSKKPVMVGVVGMPGSGKTTSSSILSSILTETYKVSCIVLPMDGYHFSIAKLKAMENPADVIYRRGAPDTFDVYRTIKEFLKFDIVYSYIYHD